MGGGVDLLAGARRSASVECSCRFGGDRIEGAVLTFVTSASGELWLLDGEDEGELVARAISAAPARARVMELAATVAVDHSEPPRTQAGGT